jgi:plasmid stabilization system protein ParE
MGQKLIIAPSARSDLHHIVQEIARDAPGRGANSATRSWIERSKQPIFPRSGRVVPEFGRDDLRELIHDPIRIIYRVRSDAVEVVRFWHAKRGTPEL